MSLNTLKLAFTIEFMTLALFRLTETKQWTPTASPADGQWRPRQLIQLLMFMVLEFLCLYLSSSLLSSPPVFPHPLCSTQWLWGSPLSCFHSSGNHHSAEALIILGKEVATQYGVQWVSETVFMDFAKIALFFL